MKTFRDEAIVLRAYKSGESDRVVVLWTKEHGKVRCIARGVRKTTSKLGGGIEPLAYVDVLLAEGRGELLQVRQVAHKERFALLRSDYDRLAASLAMIEVVDAIPTDDVPDEDVFTMLVRALRSLENPEFVPTLVPAAFYLKLLVLDGTAPQLDECVNCGSEGPLVSFNAETGGAHCADCRSGRPLSPDSLALLRRLLGGELAAVLRENNPIAGKDVAGLAQEAIERHFGRRLRVARTMEDTKFPDVNR